jgi:hypothetical protein
VTKFELETLLSDGIKVESMGNRISFSLLTLKHEVREFVEERKRNFDDGANSVFAVSKL